MAGVAQSCAQYVGGLTLGGALLAVRLHGDMSVEMVQSAVGLFATIPATLVHALDFFIAAPGALVLLGAGNRYERVDLRMLAVVLMVGAL